MMRMDKPMQLKIQPTTFVKHYNNFMTFCTFDEAELSCKLTVVINYNFTNIFNFDSKIQVVLNNKEINT